MSAMLFDAFCLVKEPDLILNNDTRRVVVCDDYAVYKSVRGGIEGVYAPYSSEAIQNNDKLLYVPTLDLPDKKIDELIDYALSYPNVKLMVKCSQDLTEAGRIDSRFGKSPVMLLHEFGLSGVSTVVSGVYLDKDDLSLMAQEGMPLVVLPTFDCGSGFGVAPLLAALERGVKVRLGTAHGSYNKSRSIIFEAAVLRLAVSAVMNKRDAVSLRALSEICAAEGTKECELGSIAAMINM